MIRSFVVIVILIAGALYFSITDEGDNPEILVDNEGSLTKEENLQQLNQEIQGQPVPSDGLGTLIGKSVSELEGLYGKPTRVDPSAYEYEWWIYNQNLADYFQVGVLDNKVVTVYAIGSNVNISPYKIGQEVGDIYNTTAIETNISLDYDNSSYRFELSEDEINNRPLIQMGDYYAQLYFDKFTGTLSSIRYMDKRTLLHIRPYELVYRGELLETNETVEKDEAVERGNEQQILDMTNVIRSRFELGNVEWDQQTANVALGHSQDMHDTETFSHTSDKFGDLEERLKTGEVFYQVAGENIAAGYADAPAVIEGWLNSKGHRECLLNGKFTHLGVGVFEKYYTQNFIEKW